MYKKISLGRKKELHMKNEQIMKLESMKRDLLSEIFGMCRTCYQVLKKDLGVECKIGQYLIKTSPSCYQSTRMVYLCYVYLLHHCDVPYFKGFSLDVLVVHGDVPVCAIISCFGIHHHLSLSCHAQSKLATPITSFLIFFYMHCQSLKSW